MGKVITDNIDLYSEIDNIKNTKANCLDLRYINLYDIDNNSTLTAEKINVIINKLNELYPKPSEVSGIIRIRSGNVYIGSFYFISNEDGLYFSLLIHSYNGQIYYFHKDPTIETTMHTIL